MDSPRSSSSDLLERLLGEEEPSFDVPGLSKNANERLSRFFAKTTARRRVYLLLLALLRHHSVRTANAMAFDLFLALVPMLGLAGWAVSRLLSSDGDLLLTSRAVLGASPREVRTFVEENLHTFTGGGGIAPFAVVAAWWLSSSAFFTLICVFEESFECTPRSYVQARLLSMGFALLGLFILSLSAGVGLFLSFDDSAWIGRLLADLRSRHVLRFALGFGTFAVVSAFLAVLYRYSIQRPRRRRRMWPGAILASLVGTTCSLGLAYYASNVARYALFYGSLAAVVVLLLWLWLWCSALLLGAEVNVALEDLESLPPEARASILSGLPTLQLFSRATDDDGSVVSSTSEALVSPTNDGRIGSTSDDLVTSANDDAHLATEGPSGDEMQTPRSSGKSDGV